MIKPAIVVVSYNRPYSLMRLLRSIEKAYYAVDDITLIISIDKSDKNVELYQIASEFVWHNGEKIIRTFPTRQGLRNHILQCGDLSNKYEAVIILEDDLFVSPGYYNYVCQALEYYKDNDRITGISLYSHSWNGYAAYQFLPVRSNYDVYLGQFSITWGQCWTKNQWNKFKEWYNEHENKLLKHNDLMPDRISKWSEQSWGKYFASYIVEKNLYYLIPYISLSTNFSDIGQHNSKSDSTHQVPILNNVIEKYHFCAVEKLIKYDIFFERIFDENTIIAGIDSTDICVDLNGLKKTNHSKRYLLSCEKYNCKIIAAFGLNMRPIDANILNEIEGKDIFLYDINTKLGKNEKVYSSFNTKRIKYESYGLTLRQLMPYIFNMLMQGIKRHICK